MPRIALAVFGGKGGVDRQTVGERVAEALLRIMGGHSEGFRNRYYIRQIK